MTVTPNTLAQWGNPTAKDGDVEQPQIPITEQDKNGTAAHIIAPAAGSVVEEVVELVTEDGRTAAELRSATGIGITEPLSLDQLLDY